MPVVRGGAAAPPYQVSMTCQAGKIYYTLDGSDPRLSGGRISTSALEYTAPIILGTNQKLFARVRSDYELWSAPAVIGPP